MKPMFRDAHGPLLRAVARTLGAGLDQPPMLTVEAVTCADWASATFVGQRHGIALRLAGPDAAAAAAGLAARIGAAEIPLAGHFVADIAVQRIDATAHDATILIEVLTLVD